MSTVAQAASSYWLKNALLGKQPNDWVNQGQIPIHLREEIYQRFPANRRTPGGYNHSKYHAATLAEICRDVDEDAFWEFAKGGKNE